MFDIVTIGSTTRDIFVRGDFPVRDDPESASGKALHVPLGAKYEVDGMTATLGGNAANAAVTAARQGLRVACFAEVGDDSPAEEIRGWLAKENVESLLRTDAVQATPSSVIMLAPSGERTIFAHHGANDAWELGLPLDSFQAPWWYVSLSGETAKHFPALMEYARTRKVSVGFNPSGYHIKHYRESILNSLSRVAFLVVNQEEAALLAGMDWRDEKGVFKKLDETISPGIVAVSYGPKGSAVSDGKNIIKAGIFPEKQLIDRTGAGDAFGSGFVAGILQIAKRKGAPTVAVGARSDALFTLSDLRFAICLATANATSVVERVGATPGILTKRQFETDPRWGDLQMTVEKL